MYLQIARHRLGRTVPHDALRQSETILTSGTIVQSNLVSFTGANPREGLHSIGSSDICERHLAVRGK